MPQSPFDLVILDCDGVLADSEQISAEVLVAELARFGVQTDVDYVFRHFVGKSFPTVVNIIRDTMACTLPPDFETRNRTALMAAFADRLKPVPGVVDVLRDLKAPFCLATSSSPPRLRRTLELCGLAAFFGDRTFTASQVAHGKPAPDLFLLAARDMQADPGRCLVVEDSEPGLLAARAAGMTVWRFTGGSHFPRPAPGLSGALRDIRSFDNWASFYQMAPELRKGA